MPDFPPSLSASPRHSIPYTPAIKAKTMFKAKVILIQHQCYSLYRWHLWLWSLYTSLWPPCKHHFTKPYIFWCNTKRILGLLNLTTTGRVGPWRGSINTETETTGQTQPALWSSGNKFQDVISKPTINPARSSAYSILVVVGLEKCRHKVHPT
ncbi:hypothetical protein BDR22DRAFT_859028 [Usnea florida]